MIRDSSDRYPPVAQMNEEQHIIRRQAPPREHFHRKEVRACQHIHVRPNEVAPACALFALRGGRNPISPQDIAHALVGNLVTQIGHCSDDAIVTPARVLTRQFHH
jgi:hypothetical protein